MQIKDYYKTLGISPTAPVNDIKKAYRKLALKYHPDTNDGNALFEVHFVEIKEAYEVLIDPSQREDYNYKRWYNRTIGKDFTHRPLTAHAVLEECKKLTNYLSGTSQFHVEYDGLSRHIREILNDRNMDILQQSGENLLINQVIKLLLHASSHLPYHYHTPIIDQLKVLAGDDKEVTEKIELHIKHHEQKALFEKYKIAGVIIFTLIICLIIYLSSR